MGWSFLLVSSPEFGVDFGVRNADVYNFGPVDDVAEELPGLSAFAQRDGDVFHTYSCYARGIDAFNVAYQLLDLAPKGRDEDDLEYAAAWLHRHDDYPD